MLGELIEQPLWRKRGGRNAARRVLGQHQYGDIPGIAAGLVEIGVRHDLRDRDQICARVGQIADGKRIIEADEGGKPERARSSSKKIVQWLAVRNTWARSTSRTNGGDIAGCRRLDDERAHD